MLRNHVVVDGSNIATEGRSAPSLTQLDEAVRAFLIEHPSEQATVIVDATFGHRIHESEQDAFEEAVNAGELLTAPAGTIGRGDAFILEVADKAGATVLSNDSFQEFHGKYTWLFDEGRLVGGKPVPGVGWVFLLRSPVRGPISRRAVQEAKGGKATRDARGGRGARAPKGDKKAAAKKSGGRTTKATAKKQGRRLPSDLATSDAVARAAADDGSGARKRARQPLEPLNEALPFIEFVGAHPVGTVVVGEVERFSSHGAYVEASGARCYVPLKLMGDPAPKSAKEILNVGEQRDFIVFSIDPPRRGIDLALANARLVQQDNENMPADQQEQQNSPTRRARKRNARRDARDLDGATTRVDGDDDATRNARAETMKTPTTGSTLATNTRADQRAEEAPVTPARKKKAAAKRTAKKSAKRAPARRKKAAAKKRPAKKRAVKRTAKKRATKKRAAKRAPARKKKAASKKRAAKKRPAKKRATKKRATKKRATKKRATTKRATKKRATKKRATKKRAAKRPAKKRATKRRARR